MKQFLMVLMATSLAIPAIAQRRGATRGRAEAGGRARAAANRPPVIDSLTSSHGTVVILCPAWLPDAIPCSSNGHTVTLTTDASDPDGDELSYKFSASVGRITGAGAYASWDLWGAAPGSYAVKVVVADRHGGTASESFTVKVEECTTCHPPCSTLSLSCTGDVEEGEPVICSANVSGGEPNMVLTYDWTVSSGRVTKGHGTPKIEVGTTGLAGHEVTAKVKVGGVEPFCANEDSFTTRVRKKGGQ